MSAMLHAETYTTAHELQHRDAIDVIEEFGDDLAGMSGKCIDIGCGPGDVTKQLILPKLGQQATIVGTDISEAMINFAREKYKDEKRLSFTVLDIQTSFLPNEHVDQYDYALSFYCLHWCQDMRQVFENIYKLLRPGGKALVTFLASNTGFNAYETISENPQYQPYMKDVKKYIPAFQHSTSQRESLREILKITGFKVNHCSSREKSYVFKNSEMLKKNIMAVNPFLERIPEDLREEYKNDLLREVMNQKIVFSNNSNNNNKDECSILDRYNLFVVYVKKPSTQ